MPDGSRMEHPQMHAQDAVCPQPSGAQAVERGRSCGAQACSARRADAAGQEWFHVAEALTQCAAPAWGLAWFPLSALPRRLTLPGGARGEWQLPIAPGPSLEA